MKKIYKCLILPLMAISGLLASCNTHVPTRAELIEEGKAITDTFSPATKTTYSSKIEGHFLDLWYSSKDPVSYTGTLGFIDSNDSSVMSSLFKVPTKINSEKFEDTYVDSLRMYLAPTTSTVSNELDIEKTSTGGILFQAVDENMEINIYGLKNSLITNPNRASICKARWNVQVEYDNTGCIVSEKAWITATHNSQDAYNADLTATYTLS